MKASTIATMAVTACLTACGGGGSSAPTAATPQAQPAGATSPSTSGATDIADTTASVSGAFTNPAGYTTAAWFEWGTSTAYSNPPTSRVFYANQGSGRPTTTLSGLTTGTTYHYRFCTSNADGTWCGADQTLTPVTMATKTTVVPNMVHPVQFVVSGGNVFWTEGQHDPADAALPDGKVMMRPLSGGAPITLAPNAQTPTPLQDPQGIAVDGTHVYWTETAAGNVKRVPMAGGAVETLVTGATNPTSITISGGRVYFAEYGSWNAGAGLRNADGTVKSLAISPATMSPVTSASITPIASGLNGPSSLVVIGSRVVWAEVANFVGGAGAVKSAAADGSSAQVTTLSGGLSNSQNVTADSTYAYFWSSYGTLARVPLAGATSNAPQTELASGMTGSPGLIVDGTSVYWAESSGFLKRLNTATGVITTLTSGIVNPLAIAQDATGIYWLESDTFNGSASPAQWAGSGSIRKISKP